MQANQTQKNKKQRKTTIYKVSPTGMAGQIIQSKDRTVEMVHCTMELAAERTQQPEFKPQNSHGRILSNCPLPTIYIHMHTHK